MEYHLSKYSIRDFLKSYHRVGCKIKEADFKSWLALERDEISQQVAFESTVVEISNPNKHLHKLNRNEFTYRKLKSTCSLKILDLPQSKRNIWVLNMILEILK
jgi:hypothetical protein